MHHPEDDLQRAVAEYLDLQGWLWWHTPNGGRRDKREAARFRRLGVRPGVPDVLIFERWQDGEEQGFGVAIELKAGKGRLSPEQFRTLAELDRRGWWAAVAWTLDEVIEICSRVTPGRKTDG